MISELKHLETLNLDIRTSDQSDWNNHKLQKLKKLIVSSNTILQHLLSGVFTDLEELELYFHVNPSVESIQQMKRITPNLKKIAIHEVSSDTINALLETLENLEVLKIQGLRWEMSERVHPKIKYLDVNCTFEFTLRADQFGKIFPNLEYLKVHCCRIDVIEPYIIKLLSGLEQLKTLQMHIWSDSDLNADSILHCFQNYGGKLEDANIFCKFHKWDIQLWFAIEKKSGGSFCINKTDCSFESEYY
jgi:hypothetical protein